MKNAKEKRRNRKWPGLTGAAKKFGVSYQHLHQLLLGRRKSPLLMSRYQRLFGEDGRPLKIVPKNQPK